MSDPARYDGRTPEPPYPTGSELKCPFCGEGDFDAIGLKRHLLMPMWCDAFEATPHDDPPSLLRPASKATSPDMTTPEGRQKAAENAAWYRETLKPFA